MKKESYYYAIFSSILMGFATYSVFTGKWEQFAFFSLWSVLDMLVVVAINANNPAAQIINTFHTPENDSGKVSDYTHIPWKPDEVVNYKM